MESGVERNIRLGALLDQYGMFLTPRQRALLALHVNEDLSLAEIAERESVSRQAVHDALRRGAQQLEEMEAWLGLSARIQKAHLALDTMEHTIRAARMEDTTRATMLEQTATLRRIWEEADGV